MRILLTNDDGIHATGLAVLEDIAAQLSDDVWVVAPELEQSGQARAVTLSAPVRVREAGPKRFAVSGINLGLFCSTPSVPLSRAVSRKRAFEMLTTGEFIDAHTAEAYGLVNRVVSSEKLDDTVDALARTIAGKPADALRVGKALFYRQLNMPLSEAYQAAGQAMADNMLFPDTQEGIDAFIEKRDPRWK